MRSIHALSVATLLVAPAAYAQDVMPFPADVMLHDATAELVEFQPRKTELELLTTLEAVTMTGFPMPDGSVVDLELQRISVDRARFNMFVDGKSMDFDPQDMSLWKGHVVGNVSSHVNLCLASYGSYGWVFDGGQYTHISSFPAQVGGWANAQGRIYSDRALQSLAGPRAEFHCAADQLVDNTRERGGQVDVPDGTNGPAGQQLLDLPMAIESDFQYYKNWSNLQATVNYTVALLGAASDRYETQMGVVLTFPYLQYHTTANDGWTSQDNGGGCGDVLSEFRAAWSGNIPMNAKLAHFLSGANLGCGVAFLDVICSQNNGFAVSGNLNGGVTFPVGPGSNTWDFVVFVHETGHNTGASHTHDYCPPIDKCYTNCTGSTNCPQGTNMSYCHLCGGMSNITTFFHSQIVGIIRQEAENSCIQNYDSRQEVSLFADDFESGVLGAGWTTQRGKVKGAASHLSSFGLRVRKNGNATAKVDTTGHDNIIVYYARRTKNYDAGESFKPRYKTSSGGAWVTIEEVTTTHWGVQHFRLPASADNNPNLQIRWKSYANEGKERGDIDDVLITGRQ